MNDMYQSFLQELERECPEADIRRGEIMAPYTTLHLGGAADLFAQPSNARQVEALLRLSSAHKVPVTIIGQGSNLLVKDGGIRGLVIRIGKKLSGIRPDEQDPLVLHAMAGEKLSSLSAYACSRGLAGLAFAGGIPGAVGGGVFMNAGAYDRSLDEVVESVSGFDMQGRPFRWGRDDMRFGYRTSRLQTGEPVVITEASFRFTPGDAAALTAEMVKYNQERSRKQPLDMHSAGSTFRRPQVPNCYVGSMIEECGLKGFALGGASVSTKHAGFLINQDGTAADFLRLIAHVQQTIWEEKHIRLETEVRILGEDEPPMEGNAPGRGNHRHWEEI